MILEAVKYTGYTDLIVKGGEFMPRMKDLAYYVHFGESKREVAKKQTDETRKAEPRNMTRLEKIEKRIKNLETRRYLCGELSSAQKSYLKHLKIEREKELRK